MNKNKVEIRLSGSGGQGMILAGVILAEAAAIHEGINATQTQSYGPEARGGASKSEVIISKEEILFPKTEKIDILLSLTQKACDKYLEDLREGGELIIDSFYVKSLPYELPNIVRIPFTSMAIEKFGTPIVVNMMALGAICEVTGAVSEDSLFEAIRNRVPKGTEDMNIQAAKIGMELAKEQMRGRKCAASFNV